MMLRLIRKNDAADRDTAVNRVSIDCSSLESSPKLCDTAAGGAANNIGFFDYYLLLSSSITGGAAYVPIDTRTFWAREDLGAVLRLA
jgi:hypothetical protein